MKYFRGVYLRERIPIDGMRSIFNYSKYSNEAFKTLDNKIFHWNIFKTIRKLRILKRVILYQGKIIKTLTHVKRWPWLYLKKIEPILNEINSITEEKNDLDYEEVILNLTSKIAVYQKSFPQDVAERTTFKEAERLLKEILLEKIESIYLMVVSYHNPKSAFDYMKKAKQQLNKIGNQNDRKQLAGSNKKEQIAQPQKPFDLGRAFACSSLASA